MQSISVLIADDHHVVREALSNLLSLEENINVVGEAKDGKEAIKMTKHLSPDVLIMDITMPVLSGEDALREIKRSVPETKVLILSMHTSDQYVSRVLKEGASGYLLKDATSGELIKALVTIHEGGVALSASVARNIEKRVAGKKISNEKNEDNLSQLTNRERQVLRLVAEGKTNKEVAKCLSISKNTVNIHRTKLMKKLNIHDVIGLVKYCIEKDIIKVDRSLH